MTESSSETLTQITTRSAQGLVVIRLAGRLDFTTAPEGRRIFDEVITGTTCCIIVNLEALSGIDSTGLATLVRAFKHAHSRGLVLHIAQPTERVARILKHSALDRLFKPYPSVEEAVAAIGC